VAFSDSFKVVYIPSVLQPPGDDILVTSFITFVLHLPFTVAIRNG
jgi:hypothetical protein